MNATNLLHAVLAADTSLTEADRAELRAAFTTRGARKGLLKKSPPAIGKPGWLGWRAIMSNVAPVRVGVFSLMMMRAEQRETFTRLDRWATQFGVLLNAGAQRPFEFNLWAMRHDADETARALLPLVERLRQIPLRDLRATLED